MFSVYTCVQRAWWARNADVTASPTACGAESDVVVFPGVVAAEEARMRLQVSLATWSDACIPQNTTRSETWGSKGASEGQHHHHHRWRASHDMTVPRAEGTHRCSGFATSWVAMPVEHTDEQGVAQ